jgi:hypothetical protein
VRRRGESGLGFLHLCADRRFHRRTMEEFEQAAGLAPDRYWVEATVGGAPAQALRPRGADYAYGHGARHMAWAAHGEACGAFPGADDERIREMLERTVLRRRLEYPDAQHYVLFASGRRVTRLA